MGGYGRLGLSGTPMASLPLIRNCLGLWFPARVRFMNGAAKVPRANGLSTSRWKLQIPNPKHQDLSLRYFSRAALWSAERPRAALGENGSY
jgi:hypothetical protein